LNRQGFPALQPYFESGIRQWAQPGCDCFSCISCTIVAPTGIKCCGRFALRPIPPWLALGITFLRAFGATHYFSAPKIGAAVSTSFKWGATVRNALILGSDFKKICAPAHEKRAKGAIRHFIFWSQREPDGEKKTRPWARFL
jgi:hypothetical protein